MKKNMVVSVDESTKKFMEHIDEGIKKSISFELDEAMRGTNKIIHELWNSQQEIVSSVDNSNKRIDELLNNLVDIYPVLTGLNGFVAGEAENLSKALLSHTEKLSAAQSKENEKIFSSVKKEFFQNVATVSNELSAITKQFATFNRNTEEILIKISKQQENLLSKVDAVEKMADQLMEHIQGNTESVNAKHEELAHQQQVLVNIAQVIQKQNEYLCRPFYKRIFGRKDIND